MELPSSGISPESVRQQQQQQQQQQEEEIEYDTSTPFPLLQPSDHLTQKCWSDFSKFVKSHPGWSAKRRAATESEKAEFKITRKGKVYFVEVKLDPAKRLKELVTPPRLLGQLKAVHHSVRLDLSEC